MITDNHQHVIVCKSYGDFSAYACTLDNARALLAVHLDTLGQDVRSLAALRAQPDHEGPYLVVAEAVRDALKDVVTLDEGTVSKALRRLMHGPAPSAKSGKVDERPEAPVTAALKEELAVWAFRAKIDPSKLGQVNGDFLQSHPDLTRLSLLAGVLNRAKGRDIRFVDDWVLTAAEELNQLQHGKWKEDAQEHRVVSRYLEFIRDYLVDRSDNDYEVSDLRATV